MYHHDIREALIAKANQQYPGLIYRKSFQSSCVTAFLTAAGFPQAAGPGGPTDITTIHPHCLDWGFDRAYRSSALYCLDKDKINNPRPTTVPGPMIHGNKIVLDADDNAVRNFDIPVTLASDCPGYMLESWRRENMSLGPRDRESSSERLTVTGD